MNKWTSEAAIVAFNFHTLLDKDKTNHRKLALNELLFLQAFDSTGRMDIGYLSNSWSNASSIEYKRNNWPIISRDYEIISYCKRN